jgi:signal transduction histidine kinase/CheY-like chemotaxis protein
MRYRECVWYLLLVGVCAVGAPPDDLRRAEIRFWGSAQGLPEENIYSISETPDGYLWLASHDGLIRFDGLNFRIFGPGAASGFRDHSLSGALAVNGNLWVGGRDYVAYSRPDAFQSFTNPAFLAAANPRKPNERYGIANMQAMPDGTIFFRRAEGVYRLMARHDGLPPPRPELYLPAPDGEELTGFYHGPSGRDWASTAKGTFRIDNGRWTPLPGQPISSATLLEARDGTVWAFGGNGLFALRGDKAVRILSSPKVTLDPVRALFEDVRGDIWVGLTGGLARIRAGKVEFLSVENTMRPGDFVRVIYQTKDNAIWATTNWGRLIRVDTPVFHTITAADGLGEDSIAAVLRDNAGRTWVGTRSKGIFSGDANGIRSVPGTSQGILHAMALAGPNQLLFANITGLWLRTQSATTLLAPAPSQIMNHYRAFSPNYGTHIYYNDARSTYRIALPLTIPPRIERVADVPMVRSILEAPDGLWHVSWDRGLVRVAEGGTLTYFPVDASNQLRAFTLFELSANHLLVGTTDGVMLFDRKTRRFSTQTPLFQNEQIFQIISDQASHLWFAGRRALLTASRSALLDYANGSATPVLPMRLTSQQGLASANFGLGTSSTACFDAEKEIWLASVGGLIHFQPADVVGKAENIPTAIAHILADGQPLPVSSLVSIPSNVRRVEIQYAVLNRKADRLPIFRYRLDGDSPGWMESPLPQADFTNLAPGVYTFQVQARLASMEWSTPATMQLEVVPQWFQRLSVRILGGALLLCLVAAAFLWRSRQIRAHNAELESRVRTRTEELAQARDEAEAAVRAKADFLAAMSHEIRTPMNGVIGMVEVLKRTPLNAEQQKMLSVVSQSGEALIGILNDILDFSKIEAGALTLENAPFKPHDLASQCHDLFSAQAADRGLDFQVHVAPDIPLWVMGDPNRLRQILLNLLSNALKFTLQGSVRLSLQRTGDRAISFEVSDTGIGIASDKIDSIFDAFTQAETSTTRRFGGTGLGLAIRHRLALAMNGRIHAASTPQRGSTFTLTVPLPATAAISADPAPAAFAAAPPPLRRVLVVEDNAVNRQVAARLLTNLGCTVTLANDGEEGIAAATREPFDLILMDCHMPGIDGYEATRRIRALPGTHGAVRIAALTAGALPEDRQRCLAAGMDDFLTKPIRSDDLSQLLRAISAHVTVDQ